MDSNEPGVFPTRFPGDVSVTKKRQNEAQRRIKIESAFKNFRSIFGSLVGLFIQEKKDVTAERLFYW